MTSRRHPYTAGDGTWIPEHVRMAIVTALGDAPSDASKAQACAHVRKQFPTLPMSNKELADAVHRLATAHSR